MYKKVSTDMNFVGREKEVEAFWKEHDIFQKSMEEKMKDVRSTPFTTDLRQQTENRISVTF